MAARSRSAIMLLVTTVIACATGRSSDTSQTAAKGPPAPVSWQDSSAHTVRFVTVPGGVRIEVLDWGGAGEPLVFIAGLEDVGHIFDTFAPRFTDRFHVLALTRRGWGASDHPDTGYTIPTLTADVHAVLDSLHLGRVDLAGHSIAGQELTWLAASWPNQVRKLVYLDAGFDYHAHHIPEPRPAFPEPTAGDSASPAAALALERHVAGAPIPEANVRATERFGPNGRDLGPSSPLTFGVGVVQSAESRSPPFAKVHAPALAIYDRITSGREFAPWLPATDTSLPHWFGVAKTWREAQVAEFRERMPRATIIELPGAGHYVFLTQPDTVAAAMKAFLAN